MLYRYACITVALLHLMLIPSRAQERVFKAPSFISFSKQASQKSLSSTPFAATRSLDFNNQKAKEIFLQPHTGELLLHNFPVGTNTFATLRLRSATPVIDGATRILHPTKQGMVQIATPAMMSYKGEIVGEEHSTVSMSYADGQLYTAIQHKDGSMVQIVPFLEEHTNDKHLLSQSNDMGTMPFHCYADMLPEYHRIRDVHAIEKHGVSLQATTLKQAEIAVEVDRFLYARLGNNEARVIAYVNAIFAVVSNKYEEEINVTFHIPTLILHDSNDPDPYTANARGDIGELLGEMRDFWSANYTNVNRDLAHLLTSPGQVGNVGGIAFLDALCSKQMGYGVSGIHGGASLPMMTYVWDSFVVTHEIGHNFSAPHTHSCAWNPPLDSCINRDDQWDACWTGERKKSSGSIMSYCHLYSGSPRYTFLPRVIQHISNYAHAQPCLTIPTAPTVRIVFPLGGKDQNYRNDTSLTIRWTSSKVNTVDVEYSLDSGKVWKSIANAVPAASAKLTWNLQPTMTGKCLVRIVDATQPMVGDTSYAVFTVGTPSISLVTPTGGERIASASTERIEWKTAFLYAVHVEFSPTGTEPWQRLASSQTGSSYLWSVPDIRTTQAKLRVLDAGSGTIIALSNDFSIGTPTIELLYPKGGEELCIESEYSIRWQSDFIKTLRLDLSTDGGTTYPFSYHIANTVDAASGSFAWNIPSNRKSTSARLRVVSTDNSSIFSESVANFTLKDCPTDVQSDNHEEEVSGLRLLSISPNPATSELSVQLGNHSQQEQQATFFLVAMNGERKMLAHRLIPVGEYHLSHSLCDIADGSYIFVVRWQNGLQTLPLRILH